jgi:hypothetical protein
VTCPLNGYEFAADTIPGEGQSFALRRQANGVLVLTRSERRTLFLMCTVSATSITLQMSAAPIRCQAKERGPGLAGPIIFSLL